MKGVAVCGCALFYLRGKVGDFSEILLCRAENRFGQKSHIPVCF